MAERGKDTPPRPTPYGSLLTEIRYTTGLSLRGMAKVLGVKHTTLSQWETGRRNPPSRPATTERFYQKLSAVPGVTPEHISMLTLLGNLRTTQVHNLPGAKYFFPTEGIVISILASCTTLSKEEIEIFRNEVTLATRDILLRRQKRAERLNIEPSAL